MRQMPQQQCGTRKWLIANANAKGKCLGKHRKREGKATELKWKVFINIYVSHAHTHSYFTLAVCVCVCVCFTLAVFSCLNWWQLISQFDANA